MKKRWGVLVLALLLVACSRGLSGSYGDSLGLTRYTFQSDGKVTVQLMGQVQETTYVRDKDRITVRMPGQAGVSLDFTLQDDGALLGPMGVRLGKLED